MHSGNQHIEPVKTETMDRLKVRLYENREELGAAAAAAVGERLRALLAVKPAVRMIFAAAPSQNEFYEGLVREQGIDWPRVSAFHMDEYIGLAADAPQGFGTYLSQRLFQRVNPGRVFLIDSTGSIEEECKRYTELLTEAPIDIVCLGIGENGHIAFNDPPVADFADPAVVKAVELDEACRQQQVNDGCFSSLEAVPTHALTLTIPAMLAAAHLYCMVPGATKHAAVRQTLTGPVSTACPASILRTHADCTLYVDRDSYGA